MTKRDDRAFSTLEMAMAGPVSPPFDMSASMAAGPVRSPFHMGGGTMERAAITDLSDAARRIYEKGMPKASCARIVLTDGAPMVDLSRVEALMRATSVSPARPVADDK